MPSVRLMNGVEKDGAVPTQKNPNGASPISLKFVAPSKAVKKTPNPARMLVWPEPPVSFLRNPLSVFGEYASPMRGPKLLYRVGARVLGIPGSPGKTQPRGDKGKSTDCSPGFQVSILPWVSYQGMLTSQRRPRFKVKLDFAFQESCTNAPPYRV